MININDVNSEYLAHSDWIDLELTEDVKKRWNNMSRKERSNYFGCKHSYFKPDAKEVLEDIYRDYEEVIGIEDGIERLWNNTTDDFVMRFQSMLDEISNFSQAEYFTITEQIDPTIDLEEVEK